NLTSQSHRLSRRPHTTRSQTGRSDPSRRTVRTAWRLRHTGWQNPAQLRNRDLTRRRAEPAGHDFGGNPAARIFCAPQAERHSSAHQEATMELIPLSDATRRPIHMPIVTALIIAVNVVVFLLELSGGESFITQWSLVPADVVAGRHWITILTSMFMHG